MSSSQHAPEEEALLQHDPPVISSSSTSSSYGTTTAESILKSVRSVDQDVSLEDAVVGRNLGWTSAVIMIFSRMIGSGVCI